MTNKKKKIFLRLQTGFSKTYKSTLLMSDKGPKLISWCRYCRYIQFLSVQYFILPTWQCIIMRPGNNQVQVWELPPAPQPALPIMPHHVCIFFLLSPKKSVGIGRVSKENRSIPSCLLSPCFYGFNQWRELLHVHSEVWSKAEWWNQQQPSHAAAALNVARARDHGL